MPDNESEKKVIEILTKVFIRYLDMQLFWINS